MTAYRLRITNMLAVADAELVLAPGTVTVVTGMNAAGKTSLATVAAGALSREANPVGASASSGRVYLRDDTDAGGAELDIQDGGKSEPLARWDAVTGDFAEFAVTIPSVPATAAPLGLVDFTARTTAAQRVALWEEYFLPAHDVLADMVEKQLEPHLSPSSFQEVMAFLRETDLQSVEDAYSARSRAEQAAWTKITGEKWGSAKGADWRPDGWISELDGMSINAVEDQLEAARNELAHKHIEHAVTVSELERAREAKDMLPGARDDFEQSKEAVVAVRKEHKAAADAYNAQRHKWQAAGAHYGKLRKAEPVESDVHVCPSCQAELIFAKGALHPRNQAAFEAAHAEWHAAIGEAERDVVVQRDAAKELEAALQPLQERLDEALDASGDARGKLAMLEREAEDADKSAVDESASEAIREAEAAVERLKLSRGLIERRYRAMEAHRSIVDYKTIAQIVGKKGVRATAMEESMARLDKLLDGVARVTGWPRVAVGRDYAVSIGKRTVMAVCAESERLRAQWALQLAVARARKEPVIILDQADHLDSANTDGLFKLLRMVCERSKSPPAILVCGTELDAARLNPDGPNHSMTADGRLEAL